MNIKKLTKSQLKAVKGGQRPIFILDVHDDDASDQNDPNANP